MPRAAMLLEGAGQRRHLRARQRGRSRLCPRAQPLSVNWLILRNELIVGVTSLSAITIGN
jgi:hypothetical protein